ncbi:MAG: hypothetical protein H6711_29835 [Myxococcales bacterium]|nr:hypothetical protein [Myxococcales bacterium]
MSAPPLRRRFPTRELAREALADGGERVELAVEVPAEMLYFDGHFPGFPILPGVAQLAPLILHEIARAWPDLGAPRRLSRLKWRQPVFPGASLQLHLERPGGGPQVRFRLTREGRACSEGVVEFPPPAPAPA